MMNELQIKQEQARLGVGAVVGLPSPSPSHTPVKQEDRNSPEYLAQLLKDKKQIQAFPNVFVHLERLLDEEVNKVRGSLFHFNTNNEPISLPEPVGAVVTLSEKLYVPAKDHPEFNFVGRILGPRGMTAKQLEQETGCKIMVRGKGSMRDKKKEELNRGKPNWEHLNEELHVLITVEDSRNRAEMKMRRAVDEVKKLLVPAAEGEDDLKKRQLMELAILNGTYRDTKSGGTTTVTATQVPQTILPAQTSAAMQAPRILAPSVPVSPALRSPTPAGHPFILTPRLQSVGPQVSLGNGLMSTQPPPLVSHAEAASGLTMYSPYDPYGLAAGSPILEYQAAMEQTAAGMSSYVR